MIQKDVIIIKKDTQSGTIKNYTSRLQKYSRISVKKHSSNFMADPSPKLNRLFGSLRLTLAWTLALFWEHECCK